MELVIISVITALGILFILYDATRPKQLEIK